jgi:alpha-beta hydrolase superfamily lysophospholipase
MKFITNRKKIFKRLAWSLVIVFILMNIVAYFHAYKFTHFADRDIKKTAAAKKLSTAAKIKTLLFGVNNPRPENIRQPNRAFQTIKLQSNKEIECWFINADSSAGTVIIFHGYSGEKSSMLDKAEEFIRLGYNTLLVDFMGSGGSEGRQTTIGYKEAEEVKTCFDYLVSKREKRIFLFGTSMGAAAVLKSINDYSLTPSGIIIECPFGSLYETTAVRFRSMNAPAFPMAGLLVFWGGVQNGFWGFSYKPTEYAKKVTIPTLLMYGEKDEKVSRKETDQIYSNLNGPKKLVTFSKAGHENYLIDHKEDWVKEISTFLMNH